MMIAEKNHKPISKANRRQSGITNTENKHIQLDITKYPPDCRFLVMLVSAPISTTFIVEKHHVKVCAQCNSDWSSIINKKYMRLFGNSISFKSVVVRLGISLWMYETSQYSSIASSRVSEYIESILNPDMWYAMAMAYHNNVESMLAISGLSIARFMPKVSIKCFNYNNCNRLVSLIGSTDPSPYFLITYRPVGKVTSSNYIVIQHLSIDQINLIQFLYTILL